MRIIRSIGVLALSLAFISVPSLQAQDLSISGFGFNQDRRFQLRFPGTPQSYYVLYRGSTAAGLTNAIAVKLGASGLLALEEPLPELNSGARFYRIRQISRSVPLDLDRDGIDDVYELLHPAFLDPLDPADAGRDFDGDGAANLEEYLAGTDPAQGRRATSFVTFPADGASDVSVTREMIIEFTRPLQAGSVITPGEISTRAAGRSVLARAELGEDRRRATLFFLEPLPGGAQVEVTLHGNALLDADGLAVDGDGDGVPGGLGVVSYRTLGTFAIQGTAVSGRVFAAELSGGTNRPLRGVTITVDGKEETLRATTDTQGRFVLKPAPAGRFFVHIDGRTSPDSRWPEGAYYPFVGKMWEATAGRTNLAGVDGEIYLPLVAAGTLQPVSATEVTKITFPESVLQSQPALRGVELSVPANALFSDDGSRGGRVGIAPVPADRLPERLPPGLNPALVITVQTDGPANFSQPVPLRFPNLPDAETGEILPPGAKSTLWSFNHDTGRWEMQGAMTVTVDGLYVESDPGTGVRQPGWALPFPGTAPGRSNPKPGCNPNGCFMSSVMGATDCAMSFIPGLSTTTCVILGGVYGGSRSTMDCMMGDGVDCSASIAFNGLGVGSCFVSSVPILGNVVACGGAAFSFGKSCGACFFQGSPSRTMAVQEDALEAHLDYLNATLAVLRQVLGTDAWTSSVDPQKSGWMTSSGQIAAILVGIRDATGEISAGGTLISDDEASALRALPRPDELPVSVLNGTIDYWNRTVTFYNEGMRTHAAAGRADFMDRDRGVAAFALLETAARKLESLGFERFDFTKAIQDFNTDLYNRYAIGGGGGVRGEALGGVYYALDDVSNGFRQRGRLEADGSFGIPALRPDSFYRVQYYDASARHYGAVSFVSGPNSSFTPIPPTILYEMEAALDTDFDGLPDSAEAVIGTNPDNSDTDGDGLSDGVELEQGSNPLDGFALSVGVLGSVDTPGYAYDVYATGSLAVVADGSAGVSIIEVSREFRPTLLQQIGTSGDARGVAGSGARVAVANGPGGLVLLDVANPGNARITARVPLEGFVRSVVVARDMAFAGWSNRVATVHLETGIILQNLMTGDADRVQDLAFSGEILYVWAQDRFRTYRLVGTTLEPLGSLSVVNPAAGQYRPRLSLNDGLAYAGWQSGYYIFDVGTPQSPANLMRRNLQQAGYKQIVPFEPDRALVISGPLNLDNIGHNVALFRLNPGGTNAQFVAELPTPGAATALALHNGLAYVADGPSGFHVLNYLPAEAQGRAPTVTLTISAAAPGMVENAPAWARTDPGTNGAIRKVDFYLDEQWMASDTAFPFEFHFEVPARSSLRTQFTLKAKATDTGGRVGWSESIVVAIIPDSQAPVVLRQSPPAGGSGAVNSLTTISACFSEALAPASLNPSTFRLVEAGPDAQLGTGDDIPTGNGAVLYESAHLRATMSFAQPLPPGRYRATLAAEVSDLAGVRLARPFTWDFSVTLFDITTHDTFGWTGNLEDLNNPSDSFSFLAHAGQRLFFQEVTGNCSSATRWQLFSPEGLVLFNEVLGGTGCGADAGLQLITSPGIYTIVVTNSGWAAVPYQFKVWDLPPDDERIIAIGERVAGNIELPGLKDTYRFTAAAGEALYFEEITGSCSSLIRWTCVDETGTTVFDETLGAETGRCGTDAGLKDLDRGGTYTITVAGQNSATSPYEFKIWPRAIPQEFEILVGGTVGPGQPAPGAGVIESPGAIDTYLFTAAPGATVYFDELRGGCGSLIEWKCEDQDGALVFNTKTLACGPDPGLKTLTRGGVYKITVSARQAALGEYSFRLLANSP